jgi:hypothetical protein
MKSDAGFSITPACPTNASRACDGLADDGHCSRKTRVFRIFGLILDSLVG